MTLMKNVQIPFATSPKLDKTPDVMLPEPLAYDIIEHDKSQRHVRGRKMVRPLLDLDRYDYDAVIDWIAVEIRTRRSTNFMTVQGLLAELTRWRPPVESVAGVAHRADPLFRARNQAPGCEAPAPPQA